MNHESPFGPPACEQCGLDQEIVEIVSCTLTVPARFERPWGWDDTGNGWAEKAALWSRWGVGVSVSDFDKSSLNIQPDLILRFVSLVFTNPVYNIILLLFLLPTAATVGVIIEMGHPLIAVVEIFSIMSTLSFYTSAVIVLLAIVRFFALTIYSLLKEEKPSGQRRWRYWRHSLAIISSLILVALNIALIISIIDQKDLLKSALILSLFSVWLFVFGWVLVERQFFNYPALVLYSSFAAICSAVLVGAGWVQHERNAGPNVEIFIDGEQETLRARLLTSSSKGLLLFSPKSTPAQFYSWEKVRRIVQLPK